MSLPASKLADYNNEHIIAFWLGLVEGAGSGNCDGQSQCWVQIGHLKGLLPTGGSVRHNTAYFEANNAGGQYKFQDYPGIGLAQDTFYTTYYSGIRNALGYYKYPAYVQDSAGHNDLEGTAVLYEYANTAEAEAEMFNDGQGSYPNYCPTIDPTGFYQYFGTNGSGGTNTGYSLDNATAGPPQNWSPWTSGVTPQRDYEMDFIQPNYAFQTTGGSQ